MSRKVRLRYLLKERDVRGATDLQVLSAYRDHGVVPKVSRSDNFNKTPQDLSNYKLVLPGDVVVNKMKAWQGSIAVSQHKGAVSGDYLVCSADHTQVTPTFLHYALRSLKMIDEYRRRSSGIRPSQWRLYWEDLADIPLELPSPDQQRAIADYLDAETARIDALITKKRRMIDLVECRFGSYIRERLAGVGPTVPLKRQWSVIDCKHRTPTYVDGGYPVISPGDVTAGRLDLSVAHRFVGEADFHDLAGGERRPTKGDIIYSRNASIGIASYVDTDESFCMGQDVCLVTSTTQNQLYLAYVLNSVGLDQLDVEKIGSTFSRVNVAQIMELQVPTPSPDQQDTLAHEFDAQRELADSAIASLHQQVGLLAERRRALITAAVTGELEIPGVAA